MSVCKVHPSNQTHTYTDSSITRHWNSPRFTSSMHIVFSISALNFQEKRQNCRNLSNCIHACMQESRGLKSIQKQNFHLQENMHLHDSHLQSFKFQSIKKIFSYDVRIKLLFTFYAFFSLIHIAIAFNVNSFVIFSSHHITETMLRWFKSLSAKKKSIFVCL